MDFEITLHARSSQEGGILASFARQLAELGGEATLVSEVEPFFVECGRNANDFFFEAQRTYRVVLAPEDGSEGGK